MTCRLLHRWATVRDTGVTVYRARCGTRTVHQYNRGGYQPVDRQWAAGGDWTRPGPPPEGPSGVSRRRP